MLRLIYAVFGILYVYLHYAGAYAPNKSRFQFSAEAEDALCPFVGTYGMRCFDTFSRSSSRSFDPDHMKLPRGVGISIDRRTGRLKALAVKITYPPKGSNIWTDGHTGLMFDIFNEAILGPARRLVNEYEKLRVQIFRNASELSAVWLRTFADENVRGGELAQSPDLLEYYKR